MLLPSRIIPYTNRHYETRPQLLDDDLDAKEVWYSVVAAAGFWHSPFFQYERPGFNRYPRDTLASYGREYQQAILDPETAVLVIEDEYRKDEVSLAYDALSIVYPTLDEQLPPEELASSSLIVGVASLRLQPQSARYGAFQPEGEISVDVLLWILVH